MLSFGDDESYFSTTMKVSSKGIKFAKSLQRSPEVLFQSDIPLVGKSPTHSESSRCQRKLQLWERRTSDGQCRSNPCGRKVGLSSMWLRFSTSDMAIYRSSRSRAMHPNCQNIATTQSTVNVIVVDCAREPEAAVTVSG
jgi:hypothetical protein